MSDPIIRFWSKVKKQGPKACWLWSGAKNGKGYGRFNYQGKNRRAHALAHIFAGGTIPKGLWVLHRCDNPTCCNPGHLYAGTPSENLKDAYMRGRKRPNPPKGEKHPRAKLTNNDIASIRTASGSYREIGARFGIAKEYVGRIRRREIWRHL